MKHILQFETIIKCTPWRLYAFHADTNNLPLITPPGIHVDIIEIQKELRQGNRAVLKIKKGVLSFIWELVFETVEPPYLIVDVATRSPFKTFRHEHQFIALDTEHTLLRDTITFSLPLGWLSLPVVWFIQRDLKQMFAYRHKETKRLVTGENI